jgi:hypothetical protein
MLAGKSAVFTGPGFARAFARRDVKAWNDSGWTAQ